MTEQEGNFVDALAGQQRAAGDGVSEAVHRRDRAVRDSDRIALRIAGV
jgi:hypothetical protein